MMRSHARAAIAGWALLFGAMLGCEKAADPAAGLAPGVAAAPDAADVSGAPIGACCLSGALCSERTEPACAADGGAYQGEGSTCARVSCVTPRPYCCKPNGSCAAELPDICAGKQGTQVVGQEACAAAGCKPPTAQACCMKDGSCQEVGVQECEVDDGLHYHELIPDPNHDHSTHDHTGPQLCVNSPCKAGTGPCCLVDRCVDLTSALECTKLGGTMPAYGITCADGACDLFGTVGACCRPDLTCAMLVEPACSRARGIFSPGKTCPEVDCPPAGEKGTCCASSGCDYLLPSDCRSRGGFLRGFDFDCSSAVCGGN